jgi:hypothetical protein
LPRAHAHRRWWRPLRRPGEPICSRQTASRLTTTRVRTGQGWGRRPRLPALPDPVGGVPRGGSGKGRRPGCRAVRRPRRLHRRQGDAAAHRPAVLPGPGTRLRPVPRGRGPQLRDRHGHVRPAPRRHRGPGRRAEHLRRGVLGQRPSATTSFAPRPGAPPSPWATPPPAASPASSADVTVVPPVLFRLAQRRSQSRPKTGRTSGTKP